jgi:hypothetical protein
VLNKSVLVLLKCLPFHSLYKGGSSRFHSLYKGGSSR